MTETKIMEGYSYWPRMSWEKTGDKIISEGGKRLKKKKSGFGVFLCRFQFVSPYISAYVCTIRQNAQWVISIRTPSLLAKQPKMYFLLQNRQNLDFKDDWNLVSFLIHREVNCKITPKLKPPAPYHSPLFYSV